MKYRPLGVALAAGVALAGCGGSSSNGNLSYSAFSQAANKICEQANSAITALHHSHPATTSQRVDAINKVQGVIQVAIGQFQALHGPATLQAARDQVVSDLQQRNSDATELISAFRSSNMASVEAVISRMEQNKSKERADIAKLGAPACAHATPA